jgi:hypothetical protein
VLAPRPTRQLSDGVEGGLREFSCWHTQQYTKASCRHVV